MYPYKEAVRIDVGAKYEININCFRHARAHGARAWKTIKIWKDCNLKNESLVVVISNRSRRDGN